MVHSKRNNKNMGVLLRIRKSILNGEWGPGARLQPALLAESFGTSMTVVREALTRLAGEGLLYSEMNRGFFVPELSAAELSDITLVRCTVEGLALELAMDRGDIQWESELTAAHHQLSKAPRRGHNDPVHLDEAWAEAHRLFHMRLIAGCGVPSLMTISEQFYNATELYRHWTAPSPAAGIRDVEGEHADILAATLARDKALAVKLLREHYQRTLRIVLDSELKPIAATLGAAD